jgi:cell division protein FtsW
METNNVGARYDRLLMAAIALLVCIGIVMVYSASSIYSKEKFQDQYFFITKHLFFVFLGLGCLVAGMKINLEILRKLSYPLLAISFLTLVFVLVSGSGVLRAKSASRWINLGYFSFQPSEMAKLAVVIFLATYASKMGENIESFKKGFLPLLMVPMVLLLLILKQPDFGTAVTIGIVVFIVMFVSGVRLSFLICTVLVAIPPLVFLVARSGYRMRRILAFLDPWKDPQGTGFQIIQSFIAFANGGLLGEGLGDGKQKLLYLPEAHTDFIFSVIGEELGFIGVIGIVALFVIFIWRGLAISIRLRDSFCSYLAVGITSMVGLQALINMGVSMGLLPTKGLTLPFISYGGSSLLIIMFSSGLLLNLSSRMNQVPSFNYGRRV